MRDWMVMLVLFSGVILGLTGFYTNLSASFGQSPEDLSFLNTSQEVFGNITKFQTVINETQNEFTVTDVFVVTSNAIFQIFKFMFFIPAVIMNILADISTTLMLPFWFVPMVMGIVFILIIFQIVSGLGKFRV